MTNHTPTPQSTGPIKSGAIDRLDFSPWTVSQVSQTQWYNVIVSSESERSCKDSYGHQTGLKPSLVAVFSSPGELGDGKPVGLFLILNLERMSQDGGAGR